MKLKDFFTEDLTYDISVSTFLLQTPAKSHSLRTHINILHLHFKGFIPSVAQRSGHWVNNTSTQLAAAFFLTYR